MIDKLSNQSRIIMATVLSFLFFATYNYFFITPKKVNVDNNQTVQVKQQTSQAPASTSTPSLVSNANIPAQTKQSTQKELVVIKAKKYEVHIDTLGRINKLYLNEKKYINQDGERIQLVDQKLKPYPLEIRFSDESTNNEAFASSYTTNVNSLNVSKNGASLILTQTLSGVKIIKELKFYPNGNYDLNVKLDKNLKYFITPGYRPNTAVDSYTFHGAFIAEADNTHTTIADGKSKNSESFAGAKVVAGADKYYATAFYSLDKGFDVVVSPVNEQAPLVFVKGKQNLSMHGYIGPKEYTVLHAIDPRLTDLIEYGFFTFISRPLFTLLSFLHSILGNWGWSIVFMTLLIRVVLFPLTYKGMVSMNKLKELSPKMKELQAKYKGDKQKLNTHMMELYKKHGANPMGGCLPMILQIPVFFAIYRVLQNTIELKSAPWILWIHDLAVMDPYYILPIAMGVTMFLNQRLTPTNFTDKTQEKIMKFLPLIFTFFFVTFPAGLTLYWFTNNLFSMAQQYYVNSLFKKNKPIEEIKATK